MKSLVRPTLALLLFMFGTAHVAAADDAASKGYTDQCAMCHGPDGKAQTEMGKKVHAADLTSSAVQEQSDSKLEKTIKSGKEKMPSFDGKLSDDDIRSVVAYVRQLGKGQ